MAGTSPDECACLVAPARNVPESFVKAAARGRRPNYVAVPWLSPSSVGDLTLVTTLERSVLVAAERLAGSCTPDERRHFADSVAWSFVRPAPHDHINNVLGPFAHRIRDKYDKYPAEGQCIRTVLSIRLVKRPG